MGFAVGTVAADSAMVNAAVTTALLRDAAPPCTPFQTLGPICPVALKFTSGFFASPEVFASSLVVFCQRTAQWGVDECAGGP